ncbi:hypothetical protein E3U55_12715 [Filobacillus milosensis]|uniref:Uncharacterized protein n=1 Tax=Filobacillus milosensis TaxID=94137 RepID=A0A4Y8IF34_9BACI|nr:hypothetical protein [Filobacillus milosensis]TFB15108.1 hypothetical protein E3U55_12715 [Filobacillus milosensis]
MRNIDLMSQAGQFIIEHKNDILEHLLNEEHSTQIKGLLGHLILLIGDRISFGDHAITQDEIKNSGYDIQCTNHSKKTFLDFVNILPSVNTSIWDVITEKQRENVLDSDSKLSLNQEIESTILCFNAGFVSAIVEEDLMT